MISRFGLGTMLVAALGLAAVSCSSSSTSILAPASSSTVRSSTTGSSPVGSSTTSSSAVGSSTTATVAPQRHSSMPTRPAKTVSQLSSNWAGPVLIGGIYDQVQTTFVIPRALCSAKDSDASFWAGIDGGGTSSTVEQAGVRESCVSGTASYVAWTEEAPAPEDDIDPAQFPVSPGDMIALTVIVNETTDAYTLDDVTSGSIDTVSATAPAGAADNSAECVAEAPTGAQGVLTLTDFGAVTFSNCDVKVVGPVAAADCHLVTGDGCPPGSQIVFSNIGRRKIISTKVKAETMVTAGGGFTVTWHHT